MFGGSRNQIRGVQLITMCYHYQPASGCCIVWVWNGMGWDEVPSKSSEINIINKHILTGGREREVLSGGQCFMWFYVPNWRLWNGEEEFMSDRFYY